VCCDGLDDALGAIAITTFHAIGRRVDLEVMAEQRSELQADATLRLGEWTAAVPYATNRLDALRAFEATPLAQFWRERMDSGAPRAIATVEKRGETVSRRDCAPLARRLAAVAIDLAVIASILQTPYVAHVSKATLSDEDVPKFVMWIVGHAPAIGIGVVGSTTIAAFFIYSAILVALGGQTLGMTVMEVRVVTTHFGRPTIVQSFWRYTVALCSSLTAIALTGFFVRVHPHDRLSRTRLVRGRKAG
jgi:uncharacterized RDD family membrane protein YckC